MRSRRHFIRRCWRCRWPGWSNSTAIGCFCTVVALSRRRKKRRRRETTRCGSICGLLASCCYAAPGWRKIILNGWAAVLTVRRSRWDRSGGARTSRQRKRSSIRGLCARPDIVRHRAAALQYRKPVRPVVCQLGHEAILPLQIGLHRFAGIIGPFIGTTIAIATRAGQMGCAMLQRQT